MNDAPCKSNSMVKRGIIALNKLTKTQSPQEPSKHPSISPNTLSINFHKPDPENDLKKFQYQMLSTEDFMLSNADFHVKNLLTNFLEDIDEEDKANILTSKIKKLKESQIEFERNKLFDVAIGEDEGLTWGKSKTKLYKKKHHASSKNLNGNSKVNKHQSSQSLGKLNDINEKKTSLNESKIQFSASPNEVYEIPSVNKKKSHSKLKQLYNTSSKGKSSNNILKGINLNGKGGYGGMDLHHSNSTNDHRRMSIPSISLPFNDNTASSTTFNLGINTFSFKHNPKKQTTIKETSDEEDDVVDQLTSEAFGRPKTYNTKVLSKKSKDLLGSDHNRMNLSYRRFQSKDANVSNLTNKLAQVEEFDIMKLKGLTTKDHNQLTRICNQIKHNVIGNDEEGTVDTLIKETIDNNKTILNNTTLMDNRSVCTVQFDEKYRMLSRKAYVYDSLDDEEFEDEVEGVFYIDPNSILFIVYEGVIFLSVMYTLLYTPYSLAHDLNYAVDSSIAQKCIEFFIDGLYMVDVLLRFFLAYYNFEEVLIKNNNEIALYYVSHWFIIDLLAAVPCSTILLLSHTDESSHSNFSLYYNNPNKKLIEIIKVIQSIKFVKLFKSNRFSTISQMFMIEFNHFNRWSKVYVSLILLLISIHILSCVFIFLGQVEYPNWIIRQRMDIGSFSTIYIASVYYIVSSVFTVGYGDIISISRSERLFNLFLLIVGIMVYSWALSSISTYIQSTDAKIIEYANRCDILEEIRLTHEKMPLELYDKIQRYLRYRVKHEKKDKNVIFETLPIGLRNNLIHEMYKPVIDNFIFFKNFRNNDFIVRVILAFKPILGLKSDILVKEGDYIEEIIFVKRGNLSLEIPLPIVVNPESLKKSMMGYTLNKTWSKTLQAVNTLNQSHKNHPVYVLDPTNTNKFSAGGDELFKSKSKATFHAEPIMTNEFKRIQSKAKFNDPIATRPYVKILEIRKNEHFGDILMFLNKRSPLSVKVKSKYAEMFFLKRLDAVEISMTYPKIWSTIIRKSLFNMEQIDRLIDKALKLFFVSHEGQRNIQQRNSSKFLETIVVNALGKHNENFYSEFPRTQEEIQRLLKEDQADLKSIPDYASRSVIPEESYHTEEEEEGEEEEGEEEEGEESSAAEEFIKEDRKHKDDDLSILVEDSKCDNEEENEDKGIIQHINGNPPENDNDTISTQRIHMNCKSITITERNPNEEESQQSISRIKSRSNNGQTVNSSTTPFRNSDINTEIYPNETEVIINADNSNTNSLIINDRYAKHNHSPSFIDDQSYIFMNEQEQEHENEYINFKTIKASSIKELNTNQRLPFSTINNQSLKKTGFSFNSTSMITEPISFTIDSQYANLHQQNNYNLQSTKALIDSILSLSISSIEKALKACSFSGNANGNRNLRHSSYSLTNISIVKQPKPNLHSSTILLTSIPKQDTDFAMNEEIKMTTMSDRIHKRKYSKSKSINPINTSGTGVFSLNEMTACQAHNPVDQRRISIAKYSHMFKDNFISKSPTFNHRGNNASMSNEGMMSPHKRSGGMSPLKNAKSLVPPKKNLMNVISNNIVDNSMNMNNPDVYFRDCFRKFIDKDRDIKEQQSFFKRLQETEKLIQSVEYKDA